MLFSPSPYFRVFIQPPTWLDTYDETQPLERKFAHFSSLETSTAFQIKDDDPPELQQANKILNADFMAALLVLDKLDFFDTYFFMQHLAVGGAVTGFEETDKMLKQRAATEQDPSEILKPVFAMAQGIDKKNNSDELCDFYRAGIIQMAERAIDACPHDTTGKSEWLLRFKSDGFGRKNLSSKKSRPKSYQ
jgi:hypothetical protein